MSTCTVCRADPGQECIVSPYVSRSAVPQPVSWPRGLGEKQKWDAFRSCLSFNPPPHQKSFRCRSADLVGRPRFSSIVIVTVARVDMAG